MPAKLKSKPCRDCGAPVTGKKRPDRNAQYFPNRCAACQTKPLSETRKQYLRDILNTFRRTVPIGSRRPHNANPKRYMIVKVDGGNWVYEHRFVMEKHLGRKLSHNEQVHHINEDTLDNRVENLMVVTAQTHRRIHAAIGSRWARHFDHCVLCNRFDSVHMSKGRCARCYQRIKYNVPLDAPIRVHRNCSTPAQKTSVRTNNNT